MNVAQKALSSVFNGSSDGTEEVERDRLTLTLLAAALGDDPYTGRKPLTDALAALDAYGVARPLVEMRQRWAGILANESQR